MLKNYMEDAVEIELNKILRSQELSCDCQQCLNDIKAIALNNLQPMYVVSEEGVLYSKITELNNQFRADIIGELTKAMKIVADNPRHK